MPKVEDLIDRAAALFAELDGLPLSRRIEAINGIRRSLCRHSPFSSDPVECIQWVPVDQVQANDYNPNTVAPPEMKLLELSIGADGYTQPVVVFEQKKNDYVVVDGFHRHRIAKKSGPIRKRLHGYLPVACIRSERSDIADRIGATIRHNRARGVHAIKPMTDIVVRLLQSGWSEGDIARNLGMDTDEVRRFKQVAGLPELFRDSEYSKSWD